MMSRLFRPLLLLLLASFWQGFALPAAAEVVVVVNPRSGVERLSRDEVVNIFMGAFRELPGGIAARPVDLPATMPEKAQMYRLLIGKDLDQVASYWSRLVFSGRVTPPLQAAGTEDMIRFVTANKGGVGYLERAKADARVRIVFEFE